MNKRLFQYFLTFLLKITSFTLATAHPYNTTPISMADFICEVGCTSAFLFWHGKKIETSSPFKREEEKKFTQQGIILERNEAIIWENQQTPLHVLFGLLEGDVAIVVQKNNNLLAASIDIRPKKAIIKSSFGHSKQAIESAPIVTETIQSLKQFCADNNNFFCHKEDIKISLVAHTFNKQVEELYSTLHKLAPIYTLISLYSWPIYQTSSTDYHYAEDALEKLEDPIFLGVSTNKRFDFYQMPSRFFCTKIKNALLPRPGQEWSEVLYTYHAKEEESLDHTFSLYNEQFRHHLKIKKYGPQGLIQEPDNQPG